MPLAMASLPWSLLVLGWAAARPPSDFVNRFPQLLPVEDYNDIGASRLESPYVIGHITNVTRTGPAKFDIDCGQDTVRVHFYRKDIVRVWLGWGGHFTDPATSDIVVGQPEEALEATSMDAGDHYEFSSGGFSLHARKQPLLLSLYRAESQLWSESSGLARNATASFQTLATNDEEFFFGGGMQNGRFSHKGHRIRISTDYNWADGGNPNAAPFFVSTSGYGVYRNTWAPGYYDFSQPPVVMAHNESRFDAFYVGAAARDFRAILEGYTYLTGRPFMPPIYGLGLGDSDCYHNERHNNNTQVVEAVARQYRDLDMPGAWFLPNDGYGCGFGKGPAKFPADFAVLDGVSATLDGKYGFKMGLWSSTGLPNISREVSGSGARIFKTDVGWIGNGYKYAFDSVKLCVNGIENNSDARRFVWTVEGWSGTQRLAVMWTGDDSGSFDYIRWQIPTFVGAGFSSQAHVTGDIDGIFGGSPETYVRDLQFKCFMTTTMTMSGWAANPDKQPWTWGEPYSSINRRYLKLKAQLTPYFYTLSREAYDTGFPPVRAMALEFPDDTSVFPNHNGSSQQFMAGPWILVAPVYLPLAETQVRDSIYLPFGTWVDFWDGTLFKGPATINGYSAPLEKLPLFVRAGAIIPMWPVMLYPGERPIDPLALYIYPSGQTSFQLYEDDGITRQALEGNAFATTNVSCSAPEEALAKGGHVILSVSASTGTYQGKLPRRSYRVQLHMELAPEAVLFSQDDDTVVLPQFQSLSAFDFAPTGWFYNRALLHGVVHVKTLSLNTSKGFVLDFQPRQTHPHTALQKCKEPLDAAQVFDFGDEEGYPPNTGHIRLRKSPTFCLTVGDDKDPVAGAPTLESQPCSAALNEKQVWQLDAGSHELRLQTNPRLCVDVNHADHMAEIYPCYHPSNPNQQFRYHNDTGAMITMLDGSCLTIIGSSSSTPTAETEHDLELAQLII